MKMVKCTRELGCHHQHAWEKYNGVNEGYTTCQEAYDFK